MLLFPELSLLDKIFPPSSAVEKASWSAPADLSYRIQVPVYWFIAYFLCKNKERFFLIYHTNILALESNASVAKPYTKIFKNCRDNKYQTQKESNKAGVRTL